MATEKRLIDANALSSAIVGIHKGIKTPGAVELMCLLAIAEQPTLNSVGVAEGKWCAEFEYEDFQYATCSACGRRSEYMYKYCPNCGADMRERKDND